MDESIRTMVDFSLKSCELFNRTVPPVFKTDLTPNPSPPLAADWPFFPMPNPPIADMPGYASRPLASDSFTQRA